MTCARYLATFLLVSALGCANNARPPVVSDDEVLAQLDAASARAQQRLLSLKPKFDELHASGAKLFVKVPLPTETGNDEWVWARITKWDTIIHAVLANRPVMATWVPDDALLEIQEDETFDYLLVHPDGREEGNETGRILEQARGH